MVEKLGEVIDRFGKVLYDILKAGITTERELDLVIGNVPVKGKIVTRRKLVG